MGSCVQAGLLTALDMAARSQLKRKAIFYVGEGHGFCQGADEARFLQQTLEAVTATNTEGVAIHTLGVLEVSSLEENFLRALAGTNGGAYRFITR